MKVFVAGATGRCSADRLCRSSWRGATRSLGMTREARRSRTWCAAWERAPGRGLTLSTPTAVGQAVASAEARGDRA